MVPTQVRAGALEASVYNEGLCVYLCDASSEEEITRIIEESEEEFPSEDSNEQIDFPPSPSEVSCSPTSYPRTIRFGSISPWASRPPQRKWRLSPCIGLSEAFSCFRPDVYGSIRRIRLPGAILRTKTNPPRSRCLLHTTL